MAFIRKFGFCFGIVAQLTAAVWADGPLPLIVAGEGPPTESLSLLHDYSDEFGGDRLNTAKWSTESAPYGGQSWSAENVTVADGVLRLTVRN